MTLLDKFIKDRLAAHVEPTRRGTPHGNPVGFFRPKFHATLRALTDEPLEVTAQAVGVSVNQIRVWRTLPDFRRMVDEHIESFLRERFMPAVTQAAREMRRTIARVIDGQSLTALAQLPHPILFGTELMPISNNRTPRGPGLGLELRSRIDALVEAGADRGYPTEQIEALRIIRLSYFLTGPPTARTSRATLAVVIDLLAAEGWSMRRRKQATLWLRLLELAHERVAATAATRDRRRQPRRIS